jgi:signal transduction histidine kinase
MLYEKECIKKDGTVFPVSMVTWLIRDEKKMPTGMWSTVTDMTEQFKAQEDLETANRQLIQSEKMSALGRFAAGVAHEVKNPLAILLGGLEYLKEKLVDVDSDVRDAIEKMREAVIRANTIIKDLLTFARPSKTIHDKIDVNVLVHDAITFVDLLRHKSSKVDVEIKQDLTPGGIQVEVDKNQMQQALLNILLNALEAIPGRGEIMIRTYHGESVKAQDSALSRPFCVIEVRDTGVGIERRDMVKLFEPFFSTKRGQKGTGLGLAIVKSIVEKHKGTISIESEVGKGATVKIMLPRTA